MKIRTLKLLADGERVERGCMSRWVTQIGQNLWLGEIGRQVQIIQLCTKRYRICTAFGTEDGGWWGQGWYGRYEDQKRSDILFTYSFDVSHILGLDLIMRDQEEVKLVSSYTAVKDHALVSNSGMTCVALVRKGSRLHGPASVVLLNYYVIKATTPN